MRFDRYNNLSDEAQKLLCYMAYCGYGIDKRMDEHFEIIRKDAFPTFEGEKALEELIQIGVIRNEGRNWKIPSGMSSMKTTLPPHLCFSMWRSQRLSRRF